MYVIQGNPAGGVGTITQSETGTFPADRCFWRTEADSDGGYTVIEAEFIGHDAFVPLSNPVLGYIGKTGRFVAITN